MTHALLCDGETKGVPCKAFITEVNPHLLYLVAHRARWTYKADTSGDQFDFCPDHTPVGAIRTRPGEIPA